MTFVMTLLISVFTVLAILLACVTAFLLALTIQLPGLRDGWEKAFSLHRSSVERSFRNHSQALQRHDGQLSELARRRDKVKQTGETAASTAESD